MSLSMEDPSEAAKGAAQRRSGPLAPSATPQPTAAGGEVGQAALERVRSLPPILQRVGGEIRGASRVLQRMTDLTSDLGAGFVAFGRTEDPKPSLVGNLAGDADWKYMRQADYDDDPRFVDMLVYKRVAKATHQRRVIDPVAEAQRVLKLRLQEARTAQPELFDAAHGGGSEGTFEYVANYLYAEVPKHHKQQIWDKVWAVRTVGDDVVRSVKDGVAGRRRLFLAELIALGLDFSWKPTGAAEIAKIKTVKAQEGDTAPGDVQPKPVGIGFHTTDGKPTDVLRSKATSGWGGILQTLSVPFFRRRYALDAVWNPLGQALIEKGPAFRRTVEDNELLSTVSIATDSHATLRFPLWMPGKEGTEKPNPKEPGNPPCFEMQAYLYVVAVREAYVTYERQSNPFGEIASAGVYPSDVIGWCKLTRWHDYYEYPNQVATADFWYDLSDLERNPQFGRGAFQDRVFNAAKESIDAERNTGREKHRSSG